jgi:3-hydroxyisobutyrate dehydrogenase
MNTIQHIGFIGLGRMGQAIVPRLLDAGFSVTVWNRTAAKCEPVVSAGATLAETPEALVRASELVITMLHDDASVLDLYARLAPVAEGRRFLEMSTVRPSTHRQVADIITRQGGTYADGPVIGTVGPARAGQLVSMVGAPASDEPLLGPVLKAFSRKQWWLGSVGLGATMKLSLNLILCSYWQLLGESLALAERNGLPREIMLDAVIDSPAALAMLRAKKDVVLGANTAAEFDVAGLYKDMRAVAAEAAALALPIPGFQAAMAQAMQAVGQGYAGRDVASLAPYFIEAVNAAK